MNAPLSHYFIYTGHNSYLTGNQLSSDCSDLPIIKALQLGVRVIELDIWPNSSKDDIDVLHGRYASAFITWCISFTGRFFAVTFCYSFICVLKIKPFSSLLNLILALEKYTYIPCSDFIPSFFLLLIGH
jgi:hypothetical protein